MKAKFAALTRTFYEPDMKNAVLSLTERSIPVIRRQPGFIGLQTHLCSEDTHIMCLIEWEQKRDHDRCMENPAFQLLSQEWKSILDTGKVNQGFLFYDILNTYRTRK